jgi:hypothetical protein
MRALWLAPLVSLCAAADGAAARHGDYTAQVAALAEQRAAMAANHRQTHSAKARARVLVDARSAVLQAVSNSLVPAWVGTRWEFYGTTETPREGAIACGYFVSTVLRDAGFAVERVKLAQQYAEDIIKTLVGEKRIRRYRAQTATQVASDIAGWGEGLYVVGLDHHVGFLLQQHGTLRFCHASFVEPPTAVTCEAPAQSPAFRSNYRVVGKLLDDAMMEAWLAGRAFRTVGNVTQ